jgi:hypothetical protein
VGAQAIRALSQFLAVPIQLASLQESWAALITTSPWTAPSLQLCSTQDFPGVGQSRLPAPARNNRHSSGWFHHSTSRARIIAELPGFFTLSQSRDRPDR